MLINLHSFYIDLGFRVSISRKFHFADIICVSRTPKDLNNDLLRYNRIHVFDYVCNDNMDFLSSLETHQGATIYVPSLERLRQIEKQHPLLGKKMEVLLPPVCTQKWISKKPMIRNFDFVHIGNYKHYYQNKSDHYANAFLKQIETGLIQVWGRGWPENKNMTRPSHASLFDVRDIYRSSHVALGMMYPHQRNLTVSGRFWQAPLNGTFVLSEPNEITNGIPGVIQTDYNQDLTVYKKSISTEQHIQLEEAAKLFWDNQYEYALELVSRVTTSQLTFNLPGFLMSSLTILRNYPRFLMRILRFKLKLDR